MAFVVPAEIGHAPYAAPLLEYLVGHFSTVHIVAVRDKLFPDLNEDCWLLHADGFDASTNEIRLSVVDRFAPSDSPPNTFIAIPCNEWRGSWNRRLRPFLLPVGVRDLYREVLGLPDTVRLGQLASVGIGYVTGGNEFFHLRPSEAEEWEIADVFLHPTVRNSRALPASRVTASVVSRWKRDDEPILLLRLPKTKDLPRPVLRYLDSEAGKAVRESYKCKAREPWYSVPDVQIPDFFLSYMSGLEPSLVRNDADCTCTNSVHSVRLRPNVRKARLGVWGTPFVQLSCELEGHPLGGGMLKLEPREATQVVLPTQVAIEQRQNSLIAEALQVARSWRHYGQA